MEILGSESANSEGNRGAGGQQWNPSEALGDASLAQGSTRKVAAVENTPEDRRGWFSCRVMITAAPKTVLCKPNASGKSTTMVIAHGMLIDHPGNPDGVKINNEENAWVEDDGLTLTVALLERGVEEKNGVQQQKTLRLKDRRYIRRGTVFEFSFFGKDKLRDPNNADAPCDFGDILRVSGVTRKLRPGDKPDQTTGRTRFFESMTAAGATHLGQLWDSEWEKFQTTVFSSIFNWLVETNVPRYKRMEIPEGFNYEDAVAKKRDKQEKKKQEEEAAKSVGGGGGGNQSPATAPANPDQAGGSGDQQGASGRQRFVSKKALVVPTAEDGYEVESVQLSLDDIKEVGDDALTLESRKFKWDNPDIYVPMHRVDTRLIKYLRTIKYPFTSYLCQPTGASRIDPTVREDFRVERKPDPKNDAGAADPNAPKLYDPAFKVKKLVVQMMPPGSKYAVQKILFDITSYSETIRYYGICDPIAQMEVLPYLIACTPAMMRTWIYGRVSAERSKEYSSENYFTYVLAATNKRFHKQKDGKSISKHHVGLIADLAAGITSAGYRVSHETACEILDALGKRPEYQTVTDKLARQVAADMANPKIKNMFGKGKPGELNPVNTVVQDAPIINCCESNINWRSYGSEYHFYVVSNWAEKNFAKYPALKSYITEKLGADPTARFSKLFSEIATRGTLADAEMLKIFGPPRRTMYKIDEATGDPMPLPVGDQPTPAEHPFACVVFAMRKDYVAARGLQNYHGDDAFQDVICKCEDYLVAWEQSYTARQTALVVPPSAPVPKALPKAPAQAQAPAPAPAPAPAVVPPPPQHASAPVAPAGDKRKQPEDNAKADPTPVKKAAVSAEKEHEEEEEGEEPENREEQKADSPSGGADAADAEFS